MKKFWSGEETRRNKDQHNQRLFRVKAVGSNPTSPTTSPAYEQSSLTATTRGSVLSKSDKRSPMTAPTVAIPLRPTLFVVEGLPEGSRAYD